MRSNARALSSASWRVAVPAFRVRYFAALSLRSLTLLATATLINTAAWRAVRGRLCSIAWRTLRQTSTALKRLAS